MKISRLRCISQDVRVILRKRMDARADVAEEEIRTSAEADAMTVAEMIATGTSAGVRAESRKKTATSKWDDHHEKDEKSGRDERREKGEKSSKEERRRKERIGRDGNARNEKGRVDFGVERRLREKREKQKNKKKD